MVVLSVRRAWYLEKEPDTNLRFTKGKILNPGHKDKEPPKPAQAEDQPAPKQFDRYGPECPGEQELEHALSASTLGNDISFLECIRQESGGRLSESFLPLC